MCDNARELVQLCDLFGFDDRRDIPLSIDACPGGDLLERPYVWEEEG